MGGIGSGHRWRYDAKSTTDDYRQLDVRQLARAGALEPGFTGRWRWMLGEERIASIDLQAERSRIWLSYRHRHADGDWKSERYPVYLAWTACRLGGWRPWFLCPARGCHRRVAILYGGTIFACRHCHRLAYASSRETASERTLRQAGKVRTKLG
ncbi:MAG: hypothetical protein LBV45_03400, partial [Xanthomonadaceae bacterium]|nr:hypothetical protein [Xanthomonadaceae bacterium]